MAGEEAFGIVLKSCTLTEIQAALDRALDGGSFVCAQVCKLLATGHERERGPLTATEKEILRGIVFGHSAK